MTPTTFDRRRIVLALCLLAVLGFYLRCSLSYGKQLDGAPVGGDFQNLQADAILAGQLDLRLDAPPGLLALGDPYDAAANQQYRDDGLHDLTLYDGKIYAYFGPAPVVLLFIPFRLLHIGELSPTLACLLLCAAGFLASVGVFRTVSRRFLAPLSVTTEAVSFLALGFAAPIGWLISIGRGYEVPIAGGYCLVMGGLYFLTRGLFAAPTRPRLSLGLGSLLLAGAVGARPNLFWTFAFIIFALAYLRWGEGRRDIPRAAWIALLAPYGTVAIVLAWYNWARFGSVSEFGTSYMLLGENVRLARADEFLRVSALAGEKTAGIPRSGVASRVFAVTVRTELPQRAGRRAPPEHAGVIAGDSRPVRLLEIPPMARLVRRRARLRGPDRHRGQ
jgi:hypothetical protein